MITYDVLDYGLVRKRTSRWLNQRENEVMEEPFGLEDHADNSPVSSRDPVCGSIVVEDQAAGRTGYAGQVFYFCSTECLKRFEEHPGSYTGKSQ